MNDKKYLVKIYRQGVFQGVLPYTVDDVQYSQEINTAGCEITVKLGTDLTAAGIDVQVDHLVTKTGAYIKDQSGNRLITRKDYMFTNVPVDIGNQADIWLYYSGAPNGKRIFTGVVSSWEADEDDATITMTALSYGVQLDNFIIEVLPNNTILNYPSYTTSDLLYAFNDKTGPYNRTTKIAETFQVISSTSISSISMLVSLGSGVTDPVSSTLEVYSGTPGGTQVFLGTATRTISNSSPQLITYTFTSPIPLVSATTYAMHLSINAGVDVAVSVGRDAGGSYASGTGYTYNDSTLAWTAATGDYAFSVITSTGALGNQFNSYDPGAIIVALLDSFTDAGGIVDSSTTSVGATGTTVSYTFKYNTILEGIQKCLELAPPNWYWYVDVGSNVLYFQHYNLTPDYTFIKGLHTNKLKIKYSLEEIKNKVIFSGGDDPLHPGTNIISRQSNAGSIAKYGQWLEKDSDNRVTTQSTADILALNTLGEHFKPRFTTTCTVLASVFNIENLKLGQMVGFQNFNKLTNSLILQIVAISRTPDSATLTLATLPPAQAHRIEDIKRNLDAVQTVNNPDQ